MSEDDPAKGKELFLDALRGGLSDEARVALIAVRDGTPIDPVAPAFLSLAAMDLIVATENDDGLEGWRITAAGLHVLAPESNRLRAAILKIEGLLASANVHWGLPAARERVVEAREAALDALDLGTPPSVGDEQRRPTATAPGVRADMPPLQPGDVVVAVQGMRKGEIGTVVRYECDAPNGERQYRVEYHGVRECLTLEPFLLRVTNRLPNVPPLTCLECEESSNTRSPREMTCCAGCYAVLESRLTALLEAGAGRESAPTLAGKTTVSTTHYEKLLRVYREVERLLFTKRNVLFSDDGKADAWRVSFADANALARAYYGSAEPTDCASPARPSFEVYTQGDPSDEPVGGDSYFEVGRVVQVDLDDGSRPAGSIPNAPGGGGPAPVVAADSSGNERYPDWDRAESFLREHTRDGNAADVTAFLADMLAEVRGEEREACERAALDVAKEHHEHGLTDRDPHMAAGAVEAAQAIRKRMAKDLPKPGERT